MDFELSRGLAGIRDLVRSFAIEEMRPHALASDRSGQVSEALIRKVARLGLSGGAVPREYGGEGDGAGAERDRRGHRTQNRLMVIASEELAYGDPGVLLAFPGPGIGGPPLRATGTEEQKRRYFAIFHDPERPAWGAYATTEPGCGSDVAAIRTRCRKDGNHYVLNGRKCFITNGARAAWTIVFATLDPELGRAGQRAFIIEKGTPGLSVGKVEKKLGLRASETVELVLEDCRVPAENLLGGEERYGEGRSGFKTAMATFDSTRPMVGAMAVGIARAALELAEGALRSQQLAGRAAGTYGALREAFLRTRRRVDAARLLCLRAGWLADQGIPNAKEASMAKAYGARVGQEATGLALELLGGSGTEEEALSEKLDRDVKVYDIFEGTGEIQRLIIARRLMPAIRIP